MLIILFGHFHVMNNPISEQLQQIYTLFKQEQYTQAKDLLLSFNIIDTPLHLSLPKPTRHLLWDLYEYLLHDDTNYTGKEEILKEFDTFFTSKN